MPKHEVIPNLKFRKGLWVGMMGPGKYAAEERLGWATLERGFVVLTITKWPCQSGAPVGAAPPTRSQLRLQRHTQFPLQDFRQWLPPAHPRSLASQCMSGQPILTGRECADQLTQPTASLRCGFRTRVNLVSMLVKGFGGNKQTNKQNIFWCGCTKAARSKRPNTPGKAAGLIKPIL